MRAARYQNENFSDICWEIMNKFYCLYALLKQNLPRGDEMMILVQFYMQTTCSNNKLCLCLPSLPPETGEIRSIEETTYLSSHKFSSWLKINNMTLLSGNNCWKGQVRQQTKKIIGICATFTKSTAIPLPPLRKFNNIVHIRDNWWKTENVYVRSKYFSW